MKNECIYVIDTLSLIFRAHYGNIHIQNGAAITVTRMLLALIAKYKPTHIVCVFDHPTPTFRHSLYKEYKANRKAMPDSLKIQLPIIKDIISALNISIIEIPGYEADDIIGSITNRASAMNIPSVIVSPDKDLLQLVNDTDRIQVLNNRDGEVWFDRSEVKKRHDVWPEQIIDMLTLAGDSSDNIKGISGIGEKGAKELISIYGNLDNIITHRFELKRKMHRDGLVKDLESIPIIKKLVTIVTDIDFSLNLEDLRYKSFSCKNARLVFKQYELHELAKDFTKTYDKSIEKNKSYKIACNINDLKEAVIKCKQYGLFSIDTETTTLDPRRGHLVGISLSWINDTGLYIPISHLSNNYINNIADTLPGLYKNTQFPKDLLDLKGDPVDFFETIAPYLDERNIPFVHVYKILNPLFADRTVLKVGQNLKYDIQVLKRHGFNLQGIKNDSMVLSFLINSDSHHNLDDLSSKYLDYKPIPFEAIVGKGKVQKRFDEVDLNSAFQYAAEDADIALQLCKKLELLITQNSNFKTLYNKIDLPLIEVLAEMELCGICLDKHVLNELAIDMRSKRSELEKQVLHLAGEPFNLNSPTQLGKILYERLHLPIIKRTTKTKAPATNESVLSKLALKKNGEIAQVLLYHRQIQKLLSTYIEALPEMINPVTNRLHTQLHQTVTATGRLASSNPNLQNIPIRSKEGRAIRAAFIAKPGCVLLDADYSQIELRVVASLANDPVLLEAFKNKEDIHQRTASEIFNIPIENVLSTQRSVAKNINFGLLYGQSAITLATNLSISFKEAKDFIERYFERMPNVAQWIDKTKEKALQDGFVQSYWGRKRYIPNLHSKDSNLKTAALREAINTVIQGTAADIMRRAMVLIYQQIRINKLRSRLILQIHDELLIETPKEEVELISAIIKNTMEHADDIAPLNVDLIVNINAGYNWLECK